MKLDKRFWIISIVLLLAYLAIALYYHPLIIQKPFTTVNIVDAIQTGFKESFTNPVILIGLIAVIYFVYKKWR